MKAFVATNRPISAILALCCAALPVCAADPDFSGEWLLDERASEHRALPRPAAQKLGIHHSEPRIRLTEDRSSPVEFTTDRNPSRSKSGDLSLSTAAKWEGAALLVNTLVQAPGKQYTVMDRWKLSRDGGTLIIRRQVVSLRGEMESTLVYERVK